MKAILLAGGKGTRITEESMYRPKPMIEIGGKPVLWHIMKIYAAHGINDFIICCGYKGYLIKEYFANYFMHTSDITFDMVNNQMEVHQRYSEPWRVTVIDTGLETMTGGRLNRVRKYIDGTFCLTYGDGVSDVNISELVRFHKQHGQHATMTVVQPPGRYGSVKIDETESISSFEEKPQGDGAWINGGFFVLEPEVLDLVKKDTDSWEREPLETLTAMRQLNAYRHHGFWKPMDTLRDKMVLDELWESGKAPWKVWQDNL